MLKDWKLRVEKGEFWEVNAVHWKSKDGGAVMVRGLTQMSCCSLGKNCYPLAFFQETA